MLLVHDNAVSHVDDASRRAREIFIVRDDDQRRSVAIHAIEQADHLRARMRVELTRRLVGEKQRRPIRQRARDRNALLFPT
jgi:hypothetical protein